MNEELWFAGVVADDINDHDAPLESPLNRSFPSSVEAEIWARKQPGTSMIRLETPMPDGFEQLARDIAASFASYILDSYAISEFDTGKAVLNTNPEEQGPFWRSEKDLRESLSQHLTSWARENLHHTLTYGDPQRTRYIQVPENWGVRALIESEGERSPVCRYFNREKDARSQLETFRKFGVYAELVRRAEDGEEDIVETTDEVT